MPTLEELEERLEVLERMLPALSAGRTPESRELEARVYEQMDALRQQLAEQQRRVTGLGQSTQQLENALISQFNGIDRRFDELTAAVRAQFENTNMPLGRIVGLVDVQEKDIREMKADVGVIKEQGVEIRQEMHARFEQVDQRFELVATHQQLAEVKQDIDKRFDQVIALLSQRGE